MLGLDGSLTRVRTTFGVPSPHKVRVRRSVHKYTDDDHTYGNRAEDVGFPGVHAELQMLQRSRMCVCAHGSGRKMPRESQLHSTPADGKIHLLPRAGRADHLITHVAAASSRPADGSSGQKLGCRSGYVNPSHGRMAGCSHGRPRTQ